MASLRPARCYTKFKGKPFTRISKRKPRKRKTTRKRAAPKKRTRKNMKNSPREKTKSF